MVDEVADPNSEGAIRERVKAALVDGSLLSIENAIVVAVKPDATPATTNVDLTGAVLNTQASVDPGTGETVQVSDGTATLPSGEVVPAPRDELHDSIDGSGALTEQAIARRADLTKTDEQRVAEAQAELDTLNARIKAAEDADADRDQELASLRESAAAALEKLEAAQATLATDEADEADARARGELFEGEEPLAKATPVAGDETIVADSGAPDTHTAATSGDDLVDAQPAGEDTLAETTSGGDVLT